MADVKKLIEGMQIIVTDLSQQADGHAIQSRIFGAVGFTKLQEKYAEHAEEERGWVIKCIDRIMDLGGEVKLEAKKEGFVTKDPVEWIKYDLQVSKDGLAFLKTLVEEAGVITQHMTSLRHITRMRKRTCTGESSSSS